MTIPNFLKAGTESSPSTATCPSGELALGGGATLAQPKAPALGVVALGQSYPSNGAGEPLETGKPVSSWSATAVVVVATSSVTPGSQEGAGTIRAYVVCGK